MSFTQDMILHAANLAHRRLVRTPIHFSSFVFFVRSNPATTFVCIGTSFLLASWYMHNRLYIDVANFNYKVKKREEVIKNLDNSVVVDRIINISQIRYLQEQLDADPALFCNQFGISLTQQEIQQALRNHKALVMQTEEEKSIIKKFNLNT